MRNRQLFLISSSFTYFLILYLQHITDAECNLFVYSSALYRLHTAIDLIKCHLPKLSQLYFCLPTQHKVICVQGVFYTTVDRFTLPFIIKNAERSFIFPLTLLQCEILLMKFNMQLLCYLTSLKVHLSACRPAFEKIWHGPPQTLNSQQFQFTV